MNINVGILIVAAAVLVVLILIRSRIHKFLLTVLLVAVLLAMAWAVFGTPSVISRIFSEEQAEAIDNTVSGLAEKAKDYLDSDGILPENRDLKITRDSDGISVTFSGKDSQQKEASK